MESKERVMGVRHRELSEARTVEEILRVTREYLAALRTALELIPGDCWPAPLRSAEDIELWADRLDAASERQRPLTDEANELDRLASHFLIASLRARQLGAGTAEAYPALRAAA